MSESVPVTKDEDAAHPVPTGWRAALKQVVDAFAAGDFALEGIPMVTPLDAATASQVRSYITEYGEALACLPEDAWATSIAQWMQNHWDVLVDLWTVPSGPSDLVLAARVQETSNGFRIIVDSVHVP